MAYRVIDRESYLDWGLSSDYDLSSDHEPGSDPAAAAAAVAATAATAAAAAAAATADATLGKLTEVQRRSADTNGSDAAAAVGSAGGRLT